MIYCLCGAYDCPRCHPECRDDEREREREPVEPEFDADAADREAERRHVPSWAR